MQETGIGQERRKSTRYRVGAPALFFWKNGRGERFQGEGVTRDISVVGAYVLTATCPPGDLAVDLEIILPSIHGASKPRIKAKTRVLRVEHKVEGGVRSGFSVIGDGFALGTASMVRSKSRSVREESNGEEESGRSNNE